MYDILVAPAQVRDWSGATTYAARLASMLPASLTALYAVEPIPRLPRVDSPFMLADAVTFVQEHRKAVHGVHQAFINWASDLGVRDATWRVAEATYFHALSHAAAWCDLVVLESDRTPEYAAVPPLGELLLTLNRPCLVVPQAMETPSFERIVLAWNGTTESLHAVRAARPLLAQAREVYLVGEESRWQAGQSKWDPPFDLSDYLHRAGLEVKIRSLGADDAHAGAALLAIAAEVGADLLVMGAYGHTRLNEWVFGGATRHVLHNASIPVLMHH